MFLVLLRLFLTIFPWIQVVRILNRILKSFQGKRIFFNFFLIFSTLRHLDILDTFGCAFLNKFSLIISTGETRNPQSFNFVKIERAVFIHATAPFPREPCRVLNFFPTSPSSLRRSCHEIPSRSTAEQGVEEGVTRDVF